MLGYFAVHLGVVVLPICSCTQVTECTEKARYLCVSSSVYCDSYHIGQLPGLGSIFNLNFPFDYTEDETCIHEIHIPATNNELWQICFLLRRFNVGYSSNLCSSDNLEFNRSHRYCNNGSEGIDSNGRPTLILKRDPMNNLFYNDFCFALRQSSTSQQYRVQTFSYRRSASVFRLGSWLGYYMDYEIKPGHPPSVHLPSLCNSSESSCDDFCYSGYADVDDTQADYSSKMCVHTCRCLAPAVTAPCNHGQFTCFNRRCIPESAICDGFDDCGDSSDEGYWHARCSGPQNIEACSFEVDSCSFAGINWSRHSTSYINPSWDNTFKTALAGHYMLAEYPNGSSAVLMYGKVPLNRTADHCLSFWYYIGGGPVGGLLVFVKTRDDQDKSLVWRRDASTSVFGLRWFHGTVSLPAAAFPIGEISFVALDGILPTNRVAIDDVSLLPGNCTRDDDVSCTFELNSCGWKSQSATTVGLIWQRRHRNIGAPDHSVDHPAATSGNAYYIGCESSSMITADVRTAYLVSPTVSSAGVGSCLLFSYFVHFGSEDQLTIHSINADGNLSLQWKLTGGNTTNWQTTSVQFSPLRGPIQIRFTAHLGPAVGIVNHFGIDDIAFIPGYCPPPKSSPPSSITTPSNSNKFCAYRTGKYRCRNDQCIDLSQVCDGNFDCSDSSDEGPGCHPMTGGGLRPEYSSNPVLASSVGITLGIVFAITAAVVVLFCLHRRRLLFFRRGGQRFNGGTARDYLDQGDFVGPSSLLPPSYNELLSRNFDADITLPPPYVDKTEEDEDEPPPDYCSLTPENAPQSEIGENSQTSEPEVRR